MMKKYLIILISLLCFGSIQIKAANADLFAIDEEVITAQMMELTALESFITQNNGITLTDLQASNNPLIGKTSNDFSYYDQLSGNSQELSSITSFLWGFCLGPIGVVIVLLTEEDDILMSVIGCLVSGVLYGGGWILTQ